MWDFKINVLEVVNARPANNDAPVSVTDIDSGPKATRFTERKRTGRADGLLNLSIIREFHDY